MSDIKKASEDMLNALHYITAEKLVKLLKEAEGDPELTLKVLQQCRGFLKDNEVSADITTSPSLPKLVDAVQPKVEELPFKVEEAKEA